MQDGIGTRARAAYFSFGGFNSTFFWIDCNFELSFNASFGFYIYNSTVFDLIPLEFLEDNAVT